MGGALKSIFSQFFECIDTRRLFLNDLPERALKKDMHLMGMKDSSKEESSAEVPELRTSEKT
jgi:hypothetical protein